MQLDGKRIIITGASSGIGAAAATLFAAQGAQLVLGARRQDRLAKKADEIKSAGGQAVCLAGDVSDAGYAKELVTCAQSEFGGLDGAFNNAGATGDLGPVPEMAGETWDHVLATNLTSAFFAAKFQIPAMLDAGGGAILFTSSFVGHTIGLPGMGAYAAAKAGLIGLCQVLAAEHGAAGIRANTLLPGGTLTEMAGNDPYQLSYIRELHALKRMATAEEIAQAALFLLSDQSSFVTGSALIADGGNSIFKG